MAKLSPELQDRLTTASPEQDLDLVLEMSGSAPPPSPGKSRAEYANSMAQAFDAEIEPVRRLVQSIGGIVREKTWTNRAVRVRVPAQRVTELLDSPGIDVIDVPHRLTRA